MPDVCVVLGLHFPPSSKHIIVCPADISPFLGICVGKIHFIVQQNDLRRSRDLWMEEGFYTTYPGCTGTQSSAHISWLLPQDSQIISLPWHGTCCTAPGCLTARDIVAVCVAKKRALTSTHQHLPPTANPQGRSLVSHLSLLTLCRVERTHLLTRLLWTIECICAVWSFNPDDHTSMWHNADSLLSASSDCQMRLDVPFNVWTGSEINIMLSCCLFLYGSLIQTVKVEKTLEFSRLDFKSWCTEMVLHLLYIESVFCLDLWMITLRL